MVSVPFITFFISWICVWNVVNSETTILCESDNDCHVVCGAGCVNGTIDGTNASSLYVKCNSNKCDDLIIQCPSTDCSIKCSGSHACDHIKIMAQDTNSVSLSAFGEDAFYKSTLLAKKAESVNIKCTSDEYTACYSNEFHLPYGSHTTFNCYVKGCISLGDLYMNSAAGLTFNMNEKVASKFIGNENHDVQNNGSDVECVDTMDIQPEHVDCLQIEGLQNMEQIRTDYEENQEMVIDVENNDNEWIINTAPHVQQDTSSQN